MIQKCVEREPAALLQWSVVQQRNRLTGEIGVKCALTMFSIYQALTNSFSNCHRPENTSQCALAPKVAELGGMRDIICTPIDSEYGDFLDYLVVTASAAWQ